LFEIWRRFLSHGVIVGESGGAAKPWHNAADLDGLLYLLRLELAGPTWTKVVWTAPESGCRRRQQEKFDSSSDRLSRGEVGQPQGGPALAAKAMFLGFSTVSNNPIPHAFTSVMSLIADIQPGISASGPFGLPIHVFAA
jgi:hypothetical protein